MSKTFNSSKWLVLIALSVQLSWPVGVLAQTNDGLKLPDFLLRALPGLRGESGEIESRPETPEPDIPTAPENAVSPAPSRPARRLDLAQMQTQIGQKDGLISVLRAQMTRKDELLSNLQSQLGEKNGLLSGLRSRLGEKDRLLSALRSQLGARDGLLSGM